jgi:hypothetical protein
VIGIKIQAVHTFLVVLLEIDCIYLGISGETVKKHLKNIDHKLPVQNRVEALNKFRLL